MDNRLTRMYNRHMKTPGYFDLVLKSDREGSADPLTGAYLDDMDNHTELREEQAMLEIHTKGKWDYYEEA